MTLSKRVQNPNQKSNGFLWALLALILVVVAVVGYIVFDGKQAKNAELGERAEDVAFNITFEDNATVLKSANASSDARKVDLFEDFSCPHCSELAIATDADMKQAIEDGKIIVHIRSLNFLDDGESGHSTQAGTASYVLAQDGDAKAYWNLRKISMEDLSKMYGNWDNKKFAELAKSLGADGEVAATIQDGSEMDSYRNVAQANSDLLTKIGEKVSSPRVFIDDKEYTGDLNSWVEEATK